MKKTAFEQLSLWKDSHSKTVFNALKSAAY
jgi:hypothetical protein